MCKVNAKLKSNKIYEKKMETVLAHVQNYGIYKNTESTKRRKKKSDCIILRNVRIRKAYP